ncbi:conserved hypothetical protein [Pseudarthrobacter chlorophenolicus A6]|uniref:DUF4439 domain-containing protein n=2 Tax=Pseudarthrobacter chlorophenolicus TaxID=85085 RepID=B8HG51_PSECP|nr:conserved hypothetical protein [Pseudarthrobacter chlorophenolicus A6]SDQ99708.1 protein of unknown function [Pseudarthrobacter chlorophenolicus]
MRYVRYVVFLLAAVLVLSLGFAVIPGEQPAPAAPTFTEQARAAALEDALELRAAGLDLAGAVAADTATGRSGQALVTLLTLQARAFLPAGSPASPSARPSASPGPAETPSPSAPAPPAPAATATAVELAKALAASGSRRLKDAQEADGGMARLLAGAGTAQLLAARQLAADAGEPGAVKGAAPDQAAAAAGSGPQAGSAPTPFSADCPFAAPDATTAPLGSTTGGAAPAGGSLPAESPAGKPAAGTVDAGTAGAALTAVLQAEQQAAYGYQAAMPRLAAEEAGPASEFLQQHRAAAEETEIRLRLACQAALPQPPGYALDPDFLGAPATGLGTLEAAALPVYGDLVALTGGADRTWALSMLEAAVTRTVHWGADPGPVPGMVLDTAGLPALPAAE